MQDPKNINISTAVIGNGKTYSIEHHEDTHITKVKVVDKGVATYYPVGGAGSLKTFEYWEHTSNLSQSIPANTITFLENDGLGLNSSSSKGVLFDGQNFDFSSLSVGSVVNITIQFGSIDNPAGGGLNHDFDVFFRHQTSNGLKRFPFVTDAATGNGGRPVFATITIPIIDEDMKQGGAQLDVASVGAISIYHNFISISVL